MEQKKRVRTLIVWYFVIVISFAFAYWSIFSLNTTAFAISEQMNKRISRYDLMSKDLDLASYHSDVKDLMPTKVDDAVTMIEPDLLQLSSLNDSIIMYRGKIKALEIQQDSIDNIIDEERSLAINTFFKKELQACQSRIDSLREEMEGEDSTKLVIDGKFVEMAQLELDYSQRKVHLYDYVINSYQSFIPNELFDEMWANMEKSNILSRRVECLERDRRDVASCIRETTNQFHANRRSSVGFGSFLYYSFCVSTTVSFGEIAPNNGLTRFLAVAELLLCLVLVGVIIDRIVHRRDGNEQ